MDDRIPDCVTSTLCWSFLPIRRDNIFMGQTPNFTQRTLFYAPRKFQSQHLRTRKQSQGNNDKCKCQKIFLRSHRPAGPQKRSEFLQQRHKTTRGPFPHRNVESKSREQSHQILERISQSTNQIQSGSSHPIRQSDPGQHVTVHHLHTEIKLAPVSTGQVAPIDTFLFPIRRLQPTGGRHADQTSAIQRLQTPFQFVFADVIDKTDGHPHRQHRLRTNDGANVAEIQRKHQRSSPNGH